MKWTLALALATVALIFSTLTAPARADWQVVLGPDKAFTIEMPGEPAKVVKPIGPSAELSYLYYSYRLTLGSEQFGVETFELPSGKEAPQPRPALQQRANMAAAPLREKKWLMATWTEAPGMLSVAVLGVGVDEQVLRGLFVAKGRRFIIVLFGGPAGSEFAPSAERFISSFHLQ